MRHAGNITCIGMEFDVAVLKNGIKLRQKLISQILQRYNSSIAFAKESH
jgi:hypothetical protein